MPQNIVKLTKEGRKMIRIVNKQEKQEQIERLAVSPREAARMIGISERSLFDLLKAGQLPHRKLKRKILISMQALRDFVNGTDVDSSTETN